MHARRHAGVRPQGGQRAPGHQGDLGRGKIGQRAQGVGSAGQRAGVGRVVDERCEGAVEVGGDEEPRSACGDQSPPPNASA